MILYSFQTAQGTLKKDVHFVVLVTNLNLLAISPSYLGAIRLGFGGFEIGMLNTHMYGFIYNLYKENTFGGLGLVRGSIVYRGTNPEPGIFANMGHNFNLSSTFDLRLELNSSCFKNFDFYSRLLIGIDYDF